MPDYLADRIRKARTNRRFSQSKVALLLCVNRATVAKWEMSGRQVPGSQNLIKLSRLLQVSHEWLVSGVGRMELGSVQPRALIAPAKPPTRTLEEERLLQLYRLLPKQQRKLALKFVETTHYSILRSLAIGDGPQLQLAGATPDLPANHSS